MSFQIFVLGFHTVSVYPKKECPFFIVFVACLFTFTGTIAILTHYNPDMVMSVARYILEVRCCDLLRNRFVACFMRENATSGLKRYETSFF